MQRLADAPVNLEAELIILGNLRIDTEAFDATIDGERIALTFQEFELLTLLARNSDCLVLQTSLAGALWGGSDSRHTRRLGVLIARLRQKLQMMHPYRIETVRKRGYSLAAARR
jgi:DNA-binding response OmpR family regulator